MSRAEKKAVFMMDVIEEIIKFRKDLDDAKKEIKGKSGKNKKSAPAKKNKTSQSWPSPCLIYATDYHEIKRNTHRYKKITVGLSCILVDNL